MYLPAAYRVTDLAELHDFMQCHSFATLVSQGGELAASHVPILLDRTTGPHGRLFGHVARANPQWRHADGTEVLVIFSGPHAYVSPTWYGAANVVPTWNYVAVHAHGRFYALEDRDALLQILGDSVAFYERSMPQPWTVAAGGEYVQKLVSQVVGFRIEITRLEGKWKLGQNHSRERRENVIRVLEGAPDDDSRAIAALMRAALPKE